MKTIRIEVTDAEYMALRIAAVSPEEFADNVVTNRARVVVDELAKLPFWLAARDRADDPSDKWSVLAKGAELELEGFRTAAAINAEQQAAQAALIAAINNPGGSTEPSSDPNDWPLSKAQLITALRLMDIVVSPTQDDVYDAIETVFAEDAATLATAAGLWLGLVTARRDSFLFTALQPYFLGLGKPVSDEQIDAAWMQAAGRA